MAKETRTYRDRAAYLITAVAKRRKRLKAMAIQYKGGKCALCGYSKYTGALDFHHLDSSNKRFGLSLNGLTRSWQKTEEEIEKCILVCANCHRELHAGIVKLPRLNSRDKLSVK